MQEEGSVIENEAPLKKKRGRRSKEKKDDVLTVEAVVASETVKESEADSEAKKKLKEQEEALLKNVALLEAVLFLESEPQKIDNLCKITQLEEDAVNDCIDYLKEKYNNADSGIELSQIVGGWQLTPKRDYFNLVKERYGKKNEGKLSKSAIETLSIIAYSQPITRAEIENYRHVNVDPMMHLLLERRFIKEVGKKDIPGKPILYGTTDEFLEFFHLQDISELPQLEEEEEKRFTLAK